MPVFLSGSLIVTGSMTTSGTITAQTLVVQTITSSIVNMTGSNRFGGQLTDRQTFTGSVLITGSLTVNTTGTEFQVTNNGVVMGNLLADSHSVTGSLRVTGSGTFTSTISAIGESTLFQGVFNDPVPNTVAVLKMSSTPTPSLASTVVGARMSGNATANVDTYAGYFSNISTVSGTGLAYGIFATASFHTFIGETRFAQGVFNDPINGTVASIKISATPRSGAPTAVFTTGITGTASSGQNTFAGYFTNTSTVSGGGVNYGIFATGSNHFFGGNVGVGTTSPSTVFHINGSTPRMAVITTSGALSSGFYDAFQILAANQTGGGLSLNVGKAESNNNLAKMVYFHSSDGSTSNRLGFGFYGADGLVNILASGNVGIGTTSPVTFGTRNLDVNAGSGASAYIVARASSNGGTTELAFDTDAGYISTKSAHPLIFRTSDTERMRLSATGDLSFGSNSITWGNENQGIKLSKSGVGPKISLWASSQYLYLGYAETAGWERVYAQATSGGVYLTNGATSWTANSDERLKTINSNIENAVDKLLTLRAVNYSWKSDDLNRKYLGLIAQDVEKVLPELVDKDEKDEIGTLGVRYTEIIPVLVKAIQELEAKIKELENK
jgi:hypothetical protein